MQTGFELKFLCPFPMVLAITPQVLPKISCIQRILYLLTVKLSNDLSADHSLIKKN